MMILTYLLTAVLVVDCLFLGLLILVQLPKKEAGAGMAFGGGTADALFGAGSGTALSKLTKYAAGIFFVLVFAISLLNTHGRSSEVNYVNSVLKTQPSAPPLTPTTTTPPPATPSSQSPGIPLTINSSNVAPGLLISSNVTGTVTLVTNAPAATNK
jgi:preprotein translocase subunit SecG